MFAAASAEPGSGAELLERRDMAFPHPVRWAVRTRFLHGDYWVKRNEPRGHGNAERLPERCPCPLWLKDYGEEVAAKPLAHSHGWGAQRGWCRTVGGSGVVWRGRCSIPRSPSLQVWPSEYRRVGPAAPQPPLGARSLAEPQGLRIWLSA